MKIQVCLKHFDIDCSTLQGLLAIRGDSGNFLNCHVTSLRSRDQRVMWL